MFLRRKNPLDEEQRDGVDLCKSRIYHVWMRMCGRIVFISIAFVRRRLHTCKDRQVSSHKWRCLVHAPSWVPVAHNNW